METSSGNLIVKGREMMIIEATEIIHKCGRVLGIISKEKEDTELIMTICRECGEIVRFDDESLIKFPIEIEQPVLLGSHQEISVKGG